MVVGTVVDLLRRLYLGRRQAGTGVLSVHALENIRIETAFAGVIQEGIGRHASILARALCERRVGEQIVVGQEDDPPLAEELHRGVRGGIVFARVASQVRERQKAAIEERTTRQTLGS